MILKNERFYIIKSGKLALFSPPPAQTCYVEIEQKGGVKVNFSITEKALLLILLIIIALTFLK